MYWNGQAFLARARTIYATRLERAAAIVQEHAKELISEPYPPASTEGNPPHLRTGNLRESVITYADVAERPIAYIGSSLNYSRFLEKGTAKMFPRPFLLRSLKECADQVRTVIAGH